jgi:hypothetical protein
MREHWGRRFVKMAATMLAVVDRKGEKKVESNGP